MFVMSSHLAPNARRVAAGGEMESARIRSFMRLEIARMARAGIFAKVSHCGWPEARAWCRACRHPSDDRCPRCRRPTCAACAAEHTLRWHEEIAL